MFSTISLQQMATLKMKEKIKILLCLLKQWQILINYQFDEIKMHRIIHWCCILFQMLYTNFRSLQANFYNRISREKIVKLPSVM
jgi:hypothetical protein